MFGLEQVILALVLYIGGDDGLAAQGGGGNFAAQQRAQYAHSQMHQPPAQTFGDIGAGRPKVNLQKQGR